MCSQTSLTSPWHRLCTCLNDYCPIALTPNVIKCFEWVVTTHVQASIPSTLDPYQHAYHQNRSNTNYTSSAIHLGLSHMANKDTYIRRLFIDFSLALNTIKSQTLIHKLHSLN